jgi:hypothetical protein
VITNEGGTFDVVQIENSDLDAYDDVGGEIGHA